MTPIAFRHIPIQTLLKYAFGILAIGLLLTYILFQARVFIAGPQVFLSPEPSIQQASQKVTLAGNAQNITEISLNGRPIHTDESGNFQESIMIENGYTIVSITAKDRYGRETRLEREFVYTPLSLYN